MLELEIGIVKFFDNRSDRRFGFLKALDKDGKETGEEIFFHMGDGEWVETVHGEVKFIGPNFADGGSPVYAPSTGNRLAFQRASGKGGRDKACPWTYAEAYENRRNKLTAPLYRVSKKVRLGHGGGIDPEIIWEGRGANALSAEYPIRVLDGKVVDQFERAVNFVTGNVTRYYFEVWVETDSIPGHWESCEDPRPRPALAVPTV